MNEATQKIEEWAREAASHRTVPWDHLPEIYLYMDQVLTYLNRQISLYEGTANPLTSSMINNYVKDGLLERPQQKKYSREHLAILMIICMLKPVLSIQDISSLLNTSLEKGGKNELYEKFCHVQEEAFADVCRRVLDATPNGETELLRLAVDLSVEANARRSAAECILRALGQTPQKKS